ncbi:hypothetical protein CASFOL_034496 [Castilleja foliolosa]|uniref:Uncharacterized protein n=1 Tax=Castilleja foliolosa TaxID=1961234 RepID=A0ABD3BR41_9LAMI
MIKANYKFSAGSTTKAKRKKIEISIRQTPSQTLLCHSLSLQDLWILRFLPVDVAALLEEITRRPAGHRDPMYTVAGQNRSNATWLAPKKLKALRKNPDYLQRVDLIQDLGFETATSRIRVSPDGEYVIASEFTLLKSRTEGIVTEVRKAFDF